MTFSAAGQLLVFDGKSPNWADISPGYAYAVVLANQTNADITSGTFTIQSAPADPDDRCAPDATKWADVEVQPQCDEHPQTVAGPATITLSTEAPLKAHSQCQYAVPCVAQFLRVVAGTGGAGVGVFIVVTRLRRVSW